jgi:predicted dehydrogenase
MMNAALKIGFIGGSVKSAIGPVHSIATRLDNRFELVAGCFSRDAAVNAKTGREWGVSDSRVYSDFLSMLHEEHKKLDAVAVLTPVFSHAPIICAVLEHGLPVISEKPLVSTSAEVDLIRSTLPRRSHSLFVTFNYTGYPMIRELRARIARGDFGDVHSIRLTMQQESYVRRREDGQTARPQAWRLEDREIPTVSLDLGMHVVHLQQFLTGGKPTRVTSRMNSFGAFPEVIDDVDVMYYTDSGSYVHGWWGKSALGYANGLSVEVFGSAGSARWVQMDPEFLSLRSTDGKDSRVHRGSLGCLVASHDRYNRFKAGHPGGFIEAFANMYADIAEMLAINSLESDEHGTESQRYVFDVENSATVTDLLSKATAAARSQTWLDVTDRE